MLSTNLAGPISAAAWQLSILLRYMGAIQRVSASGNSSSLPSNQSMAHETASEIASDMGHPSVERKRPLSMLCH